MYVFGEPAEGLKKGQDRETLERQLIFQLLETGWLELLLRLPL